MTVLFANNAAATLDTGVSASDTVLILAAGHGARFPQPSSGQYFFATLQNNTDYEIVKVTARSVDTLTVVRGQDGTTPRSFPAGSSVELRLTAAVMQQFIQRGGDTFVGDVRVEKNNPTITIASSANGQNRRIVGASSGNSRWAVDLGDDSSEIGGNAGSNFRIIRYTDSGAVIGAPVEINRASGQVSLEGHRAINASNALSLIGMGRGAWAGTWDIAAGSTPSDILAVELPPRTERVHVTGFFQCFQTYVAANSSNTVRAWVNLYNAQTGGTHLISNDYQFAGIVACPNNIPLYMTGAICAEFHNIPDSPNVWMRVGFQKDVANGPLNLLYVNVAYTAVRRL